MITSSSWTRTCIFPEYLGFESVTKFDLDLALLKSGRPAKASLAYLTPASAWLEEPKTD